MLMRTNTGLVPVHVLMTGPAQVLMTRPVQGNFGFLDKEKGILDPTVCVMPLSCWSPLSLSGVDGFLFEAVKQ